MNNIVIVTVILALIAIGVGYGISREKNDEMASDTMAEKETMVKETSMEKDENAPDDMAKEDDMMKDDGSEGDMNKDEAMAGEGSYEAYAPEKLARANGGKVVLFFKATWCPTCRALDADIKAMQGGIPNGLTILEVNYDTATDLKKKYGVTSQHTLVQVDATGAQLTKWSGGLTLETVVEQLI